MLHRGLVGKETAQLGRLAKHVVSCLVVALQLEEVHAPIGRAGARGDANGADEQGVVRHPAWTPNKKFGRPAKEVTNQREARTKV